MAFLSTTMVGRGFAEMREWTDSTGKFRVEAEFVEVQQDVVTLRRLDGKTAKIPLAKLSGPDKRYVEELAAAPTEEGPLASVVRLVFNVAGANGRDQEYSILGFAIETSEASPVIVASRLALPRELAPAAVDAGLAKAQILALHTDDVLGSGASAGYGLPPDQVGPLVSTMLVLKTTTGARIPALKLAGAPATAGTEVSVAKLSRPQVRRPGAPLPPIPWTKWSILEGDRTPTFFYAQPQDGQFPFTGSLPVVNANGEVVGILHPRQLVMRDKGRAAACTGLETLLRALDESGVQTQAPAALLNNDQLPPTSAGPVDLTAAWRTDYVAFVAGIKSQQTADGKWNFSWGDADDFGAWYERARLKCIAMGELARGGAVGRERRQIVQRIDALEAEAKRAAQRLQGIEWVAVVNRVWANPNTGSNFDLPALPQPLRMSFRVDADDASNWANVKPGDRVRYSCRFEANSFGDNPSIDAFITLIEVLPP